MTPVHSEVRHGLKIQIFQDPDPIDPRENDNLGTMAFFHRRFRLGDKHELSMEDVQRICANPETVSLPVYMYDHGGITISTSPFSCPWDSGQLGMIFADEAKIRSEYSLLDPSKKVHPDVHEKVRQVLQAEVEEYDLFLREEAYGYQIFDETGECIDSCWGYLCESDGYVLEEARSAVDHLTKNGHQTSQGQMKIEGVL